MAISGIRHSFPSPAPSANSTENVAFLRRVPAWLLWLILPVLMLGSIAIHNGLVLTLLFTPVAALIGLIFLFRTSTEYITYLVTLFAFSAFVRRIADFYSSYSESSPIISAPYVVAVLAILVVLQRFRPNVRYLAFAMAALAVLYGFAVGVLNVGGMTVFKSALRWSVPLIIGLYCLQEEDKDALANAFLKVTLVCSILAALYGVVQFVIAPPWDTAWLSSMQSSGAGISFGTPEAFGIRVFSCLNSPALCASFCCVGLLSSMRVRGFLKYPAMAVLGAALVLTMVRTVWISTALLLVFLAWKIHGRRILRVLILLPIAAILVAVVALPLLHSDRGSAMGERFSSLTDLDKDDSYVVRKMGIARASIMISSHPFGEGMGYMESPFFARSIMGAVSSLGSHDVGALEIPLEIGYLGTALYFAAMALALFQMFRGSARYNPTRAVLLAIGLNTCLLFASTNPLIAYDGLLFWLAAGLLTLTPRPTREQQPLPTPTILPPGPAEQAATL